MSSGSDTPRATFAATLAQIREQRGMTQEQLGWSAGLHQTAIARIESGASAPNFATIIKLANALEVPPADLFAGID